MEGVIAVLGFALAACVKRERPTQNGEQLETWVPLRESIGGQRLGSRFESCPVLFGSIAQLEEQLFRNEQVAGSKPAGAFALDLGVAVEVIWARS